MFLSSGQSHLDICPAPLWCWPRAVHSWPRFCFDALHNWQQNVNQWSADKWRANVAVNMSSNTELWQSGHHQRQSLAPIVLSLQCHSGFQQHTQVYCCCSECATRRHHCLRCPERRGFAEIRQFAGPISWLFHHRTTWRWSVDWTEDMWLHSDVCWYLQRQANMFITSFNDGTGPTWSIFLWHTPRNFKKPTNLPNFS